jgi:hypothetical protein
MSETSTAADVLEIFESPELDEVDEAAGRGVLKGVLIAVGLAVFATALATILRRRFD